VGVGDVARCLNLRSPDSYNVATCRSFIGLYRLYKCRVQPITRPADNLDRISFSFTTAHNLKICYALYVCLKRDSNKVLGNSCYCNIMLL
jgi:hypothetical protein